MKKLWERYSRKKRWWSIALDFIFVLLLIGMLIPSTRKPLSAFMIRQTLFSPSEVDEVVFLKKKDWEMQIVPEKGGDVVDLGDFEGKPVFLNFWATWCPPCIAEMPSIQDLYDEYKDEVAFVLISRESSNVINNFMQKNEYTLPSFSLKSRVPAIFETSTIPATYLISPAGRLMIRKTGAAKWDSDRIKRMLDDMIE
ncbi:TlpA disulfide reductase family protein [Marinilabilia rubra]|uniref:Redoxin n=1 Tax=Marinilabilia rubra TaxID=2162893 RepID=A0A2U2BBH7_9BACT|nr:TlpA disulfide reductase family protein [Marinilabilia rubra]PWE00425.1 redoxin [Marinilabilia rubra]